MRKKRPRTHHPEAASNSNSGLRRARQVRGFPGNLPRKGRSVVAGGGGVLQSDISRSAVAAQERGNQGAAG